MRDGTIRFPSVSVRSNTRGSLRRSYEGEIELFLVHCPEHGRVYCVPVDDCPAGYTTLRVKPTANNQASGVRWARDYELPE